MRYIRATVVDELRDRVVGGLHRGRLRDGDRLPSVREVAAELGVDHRAVVDAYRTLEEQGLVEVRGRSGVYVARQEILGGLVLSETSRWLAEVMTEGWKRQLAAGGIAQLLQRCTAERLSAVFVESNEDHMMAFAAEIELGFGIECRPVYLSPDPRVACTPALEEYRSADLVMTSAFHSAQVHRFCEQAGLPLLVLSTAPETGRAIERRLREAGRLTVVCVDEAFGERIRYVYGGEKADAIRVILAENRAALSRVASDEPVLLTRAARRRLMDDVHLSMLTPHSPTISQESARELFEAIIRLNLREE